MSSPLLLSRAMALEVTAAISIILFGANVTITNAQQQPTSQMALTQNQTLFQSTEDSFRVQIPEDWIVQDVNNTGSKLIEEATHGYGILAQLCPQQQQQGLFNVSASISSGCQGSDEGIIFGITTPRY